MTAQARVVQAPESVEARDARLMAAALSLGRRNLGSTWPNPAVGALVVGTEGGEPVIVARGFTAKGGRPHAEAAALAAAGESARGTTLYVSLEPCAPHGATAPCANAIITAGVARVVVPMEDPNPLVAGKGITLLKAAGVAVTTGVCAAEAAIEHAGHIRRVRDGRPHLILKLAVSADGKSGLAGRRPVDISGDASRAEAHMLRAISDAVVVGVGTVLADDPILTCRLPGMAERSPIRIVLDGGLRTPLASRLVNSSAEVPLWLVARGDAPAEAEEKLSAAGADVLRVKAGADGRLDLAAAFKALGARGLTRLLIEGGPILSAALIKSDLVDEAVVVLSPKVLGDAELPAIEDMPLSALLECPRLKVLERRSIGQDRSTRLVRR
jgi:diaminohydroxyphosphoribosylaminopyrimidine deaminase/5-amino-6-(5-phosphoribosylamino)uracil reductase